MGINGLKMGLLSGGYIMGPWHVNYEFHIGGTKVDNMHKTRPISIPDLTQSTFMWAGSMHGL